MKQLISVILLSLFLATTTQAAKVKVKQLNIQNLSDKIIIRAEFNINNLEVIDEAIDSGVMLAMLAKLNCYQAHNFWLDQATHNDTQTLQLRYFSLIQQYQLKNIEQDHQHSFVSLQDMWQYIARQLTFQMTKQQFEKADYCTLRLHMDTGALPSAMQLPVMLSNDWNFNSGSYLFKLSEALQKEP